MPPHVVQYCEEQNLLKDILMHEYTGSAREDKPTMAGESIQLTKKSPTDIHHYSQRPPVSRPHVASQPYWNRRPRHQHDDTSCQFPTIHSSDDNNMRHIPNHRSTWAPPPPPTHPHSSYYPSHTNS